MEADSECLVEIVSMFPGILGNRAVLSSQNLEFVFVQLLKAVQKGKQENENRAVNGMCRVAWKLRSFSVSSDVSRNLEHVEISR